MDQARRALLILSTCLLCLQEPTPCRAQEFRLIPNRIGNSNTLQLRCRNLSNLIDLPPQDVFFWLDFIDDDFELTRNTNIRDQVDATQLVDSLRIQISKNYEGRYICGLTPNRVSDAVMIVAYPDLMSEIPPANPVKVVTGNTAIINPLVCLGKLIEQYYIDWKRNGTLETIAAIQGPRSNPSIRNPDPRYSVDMDTFALTIQSVSFQDRGLYFGVVGVADPEGEQMEDTRTGRQGVTLEVYVPPVFIEPPQNEIISLETDNMVTFSCIVEGYPTPTITWLHNGEDASDSDEYEYSVFTSSFKTDLFVVNSTLTIRNLDNLASGTVECIAVVLMDGESLVGSAKADLSILGQVKDVDPFIAIGGSNIVVHRVELHKQIPADIQFYLLYTEEHSGKTYNTTILTRFTQTTIFRFEDTVEYRQFRVAVAIVSGTNRGPLFENLNRPVYDISEPSEFNSLLVRYLVPTGAVVLGLMIATVLVVTVVCVVACRKACFVCCLKRCLSNAALKETIERFLTKKWYDYDYICCCYKQNINEKPQEMQEVQGASPSPSSNMNEKSQEMHEVQCAQPPPSSSTNIFFIRDKEAERRARKWFEGIQIGNE